LLRILNDILDYSKIEAGYVDLRNEWFDLAMTVQEVLDLYSAAAKDKGILLTSYVERDVPKLFLGDSLRLRQILINLVGNAVKFTHEGYVRIKIACVAGCNTHIKFCVSDSGIGISAEDTAKLFVSFMQIDNSNTRCYGGTGLGLAITQRLVKLMNGDIYVESQLGQGSEFCFDIPFEQTENDLATPNR